MRDRGYLEGTHADGRQGGCGRWVPFERVASSPDLNMNPLLVASEIVLGFLVFRDYLGREVLFCTVLLYILATSS